MSVVVASEIILRSVVACCRRTLVQRVFGPANGHVFLRVGCSAGAPSGVECPWISSAELYCARAAKHRFGLCFRAMVGLWLFCRVKSCHWCRKNILLDIMVAGKLSVSAWRVLRPVAESNTAECKC